MAAAGGQDPGNIVLRYRRTDDIDLGGEQFAAQAPCGQRQHHGFDFNPGHALGGIDGVANRSLGLAEIGDASGLHAACHGVAEADELDAMAATRQNLLRGVWPQPRDHADDLARADVERRHQRALAWRDRLHFGGQAIAERVHASPPFLFLLLALSNSSRAAAAASDSRTVTRSGSRKSIIVMSRVGSFLSRSSATSRLSAPGTSVSGRRTSMPLLSRKFQRRSATRTEARSTARMSG